MGHLEAPGLGWVATPAAACQGRWHSIPVMASPCRALVSCHPPAAAELGRCYQGPGPHTRRGTAPRCNLSQRGGCLGGWRAQGRGDVVGMSWGLRGDGTCAWTCPRAAGEAGDRRVPVLGTWLVAEEVSALDQGKHRDAGGGRGTWVLGTPPLCWGPGWWPGVPWPRGRALARGRGGTARFLPP